jgi:hypothetical protein
MALGYEQSPRSHHSRQTAKETGAPLLCSRDASSVREQDSSAEEPVGEVHSLDRREMYVSAASLSRDLDSSGGAVHARDLNSVFLQPQRMTSGTAADVKDPARKACEKLHVGLDQRLKVGAEQ